MDGGRLAGRRKVPVDGAGFWNGQPTQCYTISQDTAAARSGGRICYCTKPGKDFLPVKITFLFLFANRITYRHVFRMQALAWLHCYIKIKCTCTFSALVTYGDKTAARKLQFAFRLRLVSKHKKTQNEDCRGRVGYSGFASSCYFANFRASIAFHVPSPTPACIVSPRSYGTFLELFCTKYGRFDNLGRSTVF